MGVSKIKKIITTSKKMEKNKFLAKRFFFFGISLAKPSLGDIERCKKTCGGI